MRAGEPPAPPPAEPEDDSYVALPIEDALDLHAFAQADIPSVVEEYLRECRARGWREVRLIHGKGIGNLRRVVHAALRRHPAVAEFGLAADGSGWGATLVTLAATARRLAAEQAGEVAAAAFRDATGLGRKRAIQLLEHFDRVGLLRRVGDVHKLRGDSTLFLGAQEAG